MRAMRAAALPASAATKAQPPGPSTTFLRNAANNTKASAPSIADTVMSHGQGSALGRDAATVPVPTAISRTASMRESHQPALLAPDKPSAAMSSCGRMSSTTPARMRVAPSWRALLRANPRSASPSRTASRMPRLHNTAPAAAASARRRNLLMAMAWIVRTLRLRVNPTRSRLIVRSTPSWKAGDPR